MKVLDLCCAGDHRFEGWFGSEADYAAQCEQGLLVCPVCEDTAIRRLPSAPRLGSRATGPADVCAATPPARSATEQAQGDYLRRMRQLLEQTENVGERFASEARRIHYGEAEARSIRGVATRKQASALHEEGIEVMSLPLPAALKEPLQ